MTIPGVGRRVVEVMIAEVGLDMGVFPTARHFCVVGGDPPGQQLIRRQTPSRAYPPRLGLATDCVDRCCPNHSSHQGTYLAAHHAQIRAWRGTYKAIGATRHDILIGYYHIVRARVVYRDIGPGWNDRKRSTDQQIRRLVRQLEKLGTNVTVTPIA